MKINIYNEYYFFILIYRVFIFFSAREDDQNHDGSLAAQSAHENCVCCFWFQLTQEKNASTVHTNLT